MSTFNVPVVRVRAIEPIPGADNIELAVTNDYRSVVMKNSVKPGDLAVYIPEASLLPEWLIEKLGLVGKLAGPEFNRVKIIKLRGVISQGIILTLSFNDDWFLTTPFATINCCEGDDVCEHLQITKWVQPIPTHMSGEMVGLANHIVKYDIENLKRYPDVLEEGETVQFTEKLHGTLVEIGIIPGLNHPELFMNGDVFITSKGMGGDTGVVFKNNENNLKNLYVRTFLDHFVNDLDGALNFKRIINFAGDEPLYIFGEIVGTQDLKYGMKNGQTFFRLFDVARGNHSYPGYLPPLLKKKFCEEFGIRQVPILYEGPWNREIADKYVDGTSTLEGAQIREGIVITPERERYTPTLGRTILKHVSVAYLMRRGKKGEEITEYN